MEKTINIDFNNSSSIILGYSADILYSCLPSFARSTHTHGALALYNLSGTSLSNGLTLSAAPPSAAANAVFGGSYVSLVTSGVSTTVNVTGLQPAGDYLTTAANSTHNHGGAPSITGFIGGTLGSAGWSLSIPDFLLTAAEVNHTHSQYIPIGNSTQYASSYLVNTFLTTAAPVTHIHGVASGTNITIGSSSNGLALSVRPSLGTNTSIGTVAGTIPGMTGNTSGLTVLVPNAGLGGGPSATLGGNSSSVGAGFALVSSGTLTIAGGSNITLSQDGYAITIVGAASGIGGAGTGFTSASTSGSNIVGTLNSSGLSIGIPVYLTTAMLSNNTSLFEYTSHTSAITSNAVNKSQSSLFQHVSATSEITSNAVNTSISSQWLTTAMQSNYTSVFQYTSATSAITSNAMNTNAASNFVGLNSSIEGANMTMNSSGLTLSIPMATATAANAVHAGDYISLSTAGGDTTVSVINLQATSATSLITSNAMNTSERVNYFYSSNNTFANNTHLHGNISLSLSNISGTYSSASNGLTLSLTGNTAAVGGIVLQDGINSITSGSAYLSDINGISFGISGNTITASHNAYSASSQLSATFANTSHTHSNLYIPLSASTAYQTSVLDNTFAVTSHTHTEGNVYFVNSLGSNLTWGSSTSGGSTSIFATAGGGTGGGTGGVAIRGSGTYIQSTGTVQFSNSNGLIFGLSNGTMTASMSQASLAFSDSNGVSFGLYSSNASGSTITASVAVGGGGSNTVYGIGNTASDSSMSYSDGQAYSISASNNITVRVADKLIQLWGANPGIVGLGNTATVPFTSGSVRISGINLTVNTSSSGASQYLQISAPAMGYLFFSNTNGHSWGSSVNGMSTSIYIIT